jgi:hypothetical protein
MGVYSQHGQNMGQISKFAHNTYSQSGEDGIIAELLKRIESRFPLNNWCVEFGAWDGLYLSNTANLLKNSNYKAILIEGDRKKAKEIKVNFPANDVIALNQFVHFEGEFSMDSILSQTSIPRDFDFLSIDIDGAD